MQLKSEDIDFSATDALGLSNATNIDQINFEATDAKFREPFLYAEPREADPLDIGTMIGLEVVPAILGAMSPLGVYGAAGGGALGNYWSQKYRQSIGLQDDLSMAELGTATAASAIPLTALARGGGIARGAAVRGGQGSMIATAELAARVGLERGELPTQEEWATTVLFGGIFGGTLGAVEAKYLQKALDAPSIKEGDTRPQVMDKVAEEIEARRGTQMEFDFPENMSSREAAELSVARAEGEVMGQLDQTIGATANKRRTGEPLSEGEAALDAKLTEDIKSREVESVDPVKPQIRKGLSQKDRSRLDQVDDELQSTIKEDHTAKSVTPEHSLPSGLARAKPRYGYRGDNYELGFANDVDRALYIVAGKRPSKKDADYLRFLKTVFKGKNTAALRKMGADVREQIKGIAAKGDPSGVLTIPPSKHFDSLSKAATKAAAAARKSKVKKLAEEKAKLEKKATELPPKLAKKVEKAKAKYSGRGPYSKKTYELVLEDGTVAATVVATTKRGASKIAHEKGVAPVGAFYTRKAGDAKDAARLEKTLRDVAEKKAAKAPAPLAKPVADAPEAKATVGAIRKAKEVEVDIAEVTGTGAKGRVTIKDVLAHRAASAPRDTAAGGIAKPAQAAPVARSVSEEAAELANLVKQGDHPSDMGLEQKFSKDSLMLWEARELVKKESKRPKRVDNETDNSDSFYLGDEFGWVIKVGDDHYGLTKYEDIDAVSDAVDQYGYPKEFEYAYANLKDPKNIIESGTRKIPEVIAQIKKEQGAPSKLKQTAVPSLIAAGGGIAAMTDDEKDALSSSASIGEFILWMAAMGVSWKVAKRILRTPEGKLLKNNTDVRRKAMDEANVRDNGDTFSEGKVVDVASDEQMYRDARWTESRWDDIKKITRHALEPMSRTLKKIDPVLNKLFQNLGFKTNRTIGRYLERMTFAKAMTLAIRGNNPLKPQNDLDWRLFRKSLRNKSYRTYLPEELEGSREGYLMVGDGLLAKKGDYDSAQVAERDLQGLMQKYNPQVKAYMRKKHKGDRHKRDRGAVFLYNEYNVAIKELRGWARSKGGLPIGELENYFPSGLKDWERFRNFMSKHEGWDELENEIIREIDKVEMKWNTPATREEQSEIASAYLRRKVESGTMPSHLKHRVLDSIEDNVVDAYHEPTAITESYVRKMVTSTLTREFLGVPKEPLIRKHVVDIPEHLGETRDVVPMSDLGLDFDLDGAVSDYLAKNKFAERFGREEVEKIREVMQARFSARGYGGLVGDAKNLTYISVLGNFGAAITQLGDQAFSFHFNGLGPTFRAWFDKTLPDFYTQFGLNSADIDLTNSRDGLSKLLNMALTATGFNALDKFGKNTVMKGAFVRMQNLAKNNPSKLLNELEPRHGKAGANQIRNDLLSDNPFTDAVEGEIFAKLLEVQPAAASEMTITQTRAMNLPPVAREVVSSAYWLKTFTIKQWDTFLYQSNGKISKAHELWKKGDKNGAVKSAAEGLKGLTMLAAWFGAMNAGTSVIKDTIYGRKTNLDELQTDLAFRLMGISRYNVWRARREGTLKSAVEFFMPGTTAIDRAEKDLRAIFSGETPPAETIRGIGVGDFYYWHYGGGREKTRKEIAKQYGLKLEYVPK